MTIYFDNNAAKPARQPRAAAIGDDRARRLHEHHRLTGRPLAQFGGMQVVVAADAEDAGRAR